MKTCYLVRHQKAGILTEYVFTTAPTDEQLAPILAALERLHGAGPWVRIHEAQLLDATELPPTTTREQAGVTVADVGHGFLQLFAPSGAGTVRNP